MKTKSGLLEELGMMKINERFYTVLSETQALPSTMAIKGTVKHFVLRFGKQLFMADEYKDGKIKVKKVSKSLLSILF